MRGHLELELGDTVSGDEYRCLTITLFLAGDPGAYLAEVPPQVGRVVPRAVR